MGVAFGGGAPISGRRIWSGAVLIWDPGLYEAGGGVRWDWGCSVWLVGAGVGCVSIAYGVLSRGLALLGVWLPVWVIVLLLVGVGLGLAVILLLCLVFSGMGERQEWFGEILLGRH